MNAQVSHREVVTQCARTFGRPNSSIEGLDGNGDFGVSPAVGSRSKRITNLKNRQMFAIAGIYEVWTDPKTGQDTELHHDHGAAKRRGRISMEITNVQAGIPLMRCCCRVQGSTGN